MEHETIGRRQMIRRAGAVAGGVAVSTIAVGGVASAESRNGDEASNGLLGAWRTVRQNDGDSQTTLSVVFLAAGGATGIQDLDPAGGTLSGGFTAGPHRSFRSTLFQGTLPDGAFPGSPALVAEVHVMGTFHGDSISGTYTSRIADATGASFGEVTGSFTGTRVIA